MVVLDILMLFLRKGPDQLLILLMSVCHLLRAASMQKQVFTRCGCLFAVQSVNFGCFFLLFWTLLGRKRCWEQSKSLDMRGAEMPALEDFNWQGHSPALPLETICCFPRR